MRTFLALALVATCGTASGATLAFHHYAEISVSTESDSFFIASDNSSDLGFVGPPGRKVSVHLDHNDSDPLRHSFGDAFTFHRYVDDQGTLYSPGSSSVRFVWELDNAHPVTATIFGPHLLDGQPVELDPMFDRAILELPPGAYVLEQTWSSQFSRSGSLTGELRLIPAPEPSTVVLMAICGIAWLGVNSGCRLAAAP